MWIASLNGYLSVVRNVNSKGPYEELLVRARVRADLTDLVQHIIDSSKGVEHPIIACTPEADYPFRILASRIDLSEYLHTLVKEIDYTNFKSEVAKSDPYRAQIYGGVWAVLRELTPRVPR